MTSLKPERNGRLVWRLGMSFVLFVIVGSVALAFWLRREEQIRSRETFESMGSSNAEFLRRTGLPASERMAQNLKEVTGLPVYFRQVGSQFTPSLPGELRAESGWLTELTPNGRSARRGSLEALAQPLHDDVDVIFVRTADAPLAFFSRPGAVLGMAAFWLLSLALAAAIARTVVRPLRSLTDALPRIGEPGPLHLPGADRRDEIGQLARVFLETQRQLTQERAAREAAERLALLGKMATGLAHEIQNPVTAIRMHGQLLQRQHPGQASLEMIIGETAKIEELVNQWQFLSRPEPPQTSAVDLAELVRTSMEAAQLRAEHAGVRIESAPPSGKILVQADRRRLAQVFGNVLVNAIQAMPMGGVLTLSFEEDDAFATVAVRDQGAGFSAVALERWREMFFSEKEGGMGIGLSVANEVVKAHGGSMSVENATEGGAVVRITLPKTGGES